MATTTATARTFIVITKKDGQVTFTSTLTLREAADICRTSAVDMARDLARRVDKGWSMSPARTAWLHYFAIEAQREAAEANECEDVNESDSVPTPPEAPTPPPASIATIHTAVCSVLLCLEADTVTVTSPSKNSATVGLPALRKADESLYEKLTADWIDDGEACGVRLTYDEMRTVRNLSVPTMAETTPTVSTPTPTVMGTPPVPVPTVVAPAPIVPLDPAEETVMDAIAARTAAKMTSGSTVAATRYIGGGSEEGRLRQAEAMKEWVGGDIASLSYYIPDRLKSVVSCPVAILRRAGFSWMDNSNYFGPMEKCFAHPTVKRLLADWEKIRFDTFDPTLGMKGNLTFDVVRFHPDDVDKMRAIAVRNLDQAMRDAHGSLITRIANADDRLKKAEQEFADREAANAEVTEKDRLEAIRARDNAVRAVLRDSGEALNNAIKNAENFDETESTKDLIAGLRAAIKAEQEAFNAEMKMRPWDRRTKTSNVTV